MSLRFRCRTHIRSVRSDTVRSPDVLDVPADTSEQHRVDAKLISVRDHTLRTCRTGQIAGLECMTMCVVDEANAVLMANTQLLGVLHHST